MDIGTRQGLAIETLDIRLQVGGHQWRVGALVMRPFADLLRHQLLKRRHGLALGHQLPGRQPLRRNDGQQQKGRERQARAPAHRITLGGILPSSPC